MTLAVSCLETLTHFALAMRVETARLQRESILVTVSKNAAA